MGGDDGMAGRGGFQFIGDVLAGLPPGRQLVGGAKGGQHAGQFVAPRRQGALNAGHQHLLRGRRRV